MDLPVGEQRMARGAGKRRRRVEHLSRRLQGIRERPGEPLGLKPLGHRLEKRLRREGRR
jgi:hypothetical protein